MSFTNNSLLYILCLGILSCQSEQTETSNNTFGELQYQLNTFDELTHTQVMTLGTFHFDETVLTPESQDALEQLLSDLSEYEPTKVVLELSPHLFDTINHTYQLYLKDSFDISTQANEVYQVGFKLAKYMKHDSIFLFDDQTEFIGSLTDFSFEAFSEYARQNDDGFYNAYEDQITSKFDKNQSIFQQLDLRDEIALRNSPVAQQFNAQRMHAYETRVGIQKSWIGPDWLGRWYRRNVRMMSNVLQLHTKGDRILILVGDNHKWTLDMLFEYTPDFEVVSSWDYLK